MIVDYDFNKNDLIEYNLWIIKSKKSHLIGGLIVSIIYFVIGIGLILVSFVADDFNFLYFTGGVSLTVLAFQKSDLKRNIKNRIDKLERQGKLSFFFGQKHLEIHGDKLFLRDSVSELKISGTAITDLGIKGNCIVVEFGLNSLYIPTRNFKSEYELNEIVEKLKLVRTIEDKNP